MPEPAVQIVCHGGEHGVTVTSPVRYGNTRSSFFLSAARLHTLTQQRYYTSPIDGSVRLTQVLVAAGMLHQDAFGHYEPTALTAELVLKVRQQDCCRSA